MLMKERKILKLEFFQKAMPNLSRIFVKKILYF
jgi:hypothetical protein